MKNIIDFILNNNIIDLIIYITIGLVIYNILRKIVLVKIKKLNKKRGETIKNIV